MTADPAAARSTGPSTGPAADPVSGPTGTARPYTTPIRTADWDTGGEPFRIVPEPPPAVTGPGLTVAERRTVAIAIAIAIADAGAQWTRALLCGEPRGHADNVPGHVHARGVAVATSCGALTVDIAFGGAMYAVLPVDRLGLGLRVRPEDVTALIAAGREIRDALNAVRAAEHPDDARLSGVYGTVFTEEAAAPVELPDGTRRLHHCNVTVFADGQVDRSPCGSGTAARVALLADAGELRLGGELRHESVVSSVFRARIERPTTVHGRPAVVPAVTGTAYATGTGRFTVDPDDALVPGFVLR
ncbi:proline racemase family protein [Streptomyces sp. SID14515]|uniref:proline racemase family protein n=1 Tax=Streptomyces sp. SID14515 TaxID=2706074 RepID=UPI0013C8A46E|nr:proline racemase family protein [Streptomyces sp. SID14515]NEB38292.1 proline racemase family protein [Streptomyces sp. SID14515]